jgi:hypothetical protein
MSKRTVMVTMLGGVVGLSLLASAGCGSGSGSSRSGSPNDSRRGALVAFAACMRTHGLPNFPDPKAVRNGYGLTLGPETGIDPNSPQFKNAQQACRKLLPNGGRQSSQERAKQLQVALSYAACVRSHGVPDFPDPKVSSNGGIEIGPGPNSNLNPDSPQLNAAENACRHLLPDA